MITCIDTLAPASCAPPTNHLLAAGHIIVWRVSSTGTLEEERRLRDETDGLEGGCKEKGSAHLGGITALVSPSPGSTTLVSGSADGAIKVWDLLEGGPPRTLLQCPRGICSLAWLHRPHGGNDGPMTNWLACGACFFCFCGCRFIAGRQPAHTVSLD